MAVMSAFSMVVVLADMTAAETEISMGNQKVDEMAAEMVSGLVAPLVEMRVFHLVVQMVD